MRAKYERDAMLACMPGADIPIRWSDGADDLGGALAVRVRVFCGEQGVPLDEEPDALDEVALHLVALSPCEDPQGSSVVATLRLLLDEEVARIGRVAVLAAWRGRGIASRMLALAVARAREEGHRRVRLAAQIRAKALYEHAGFSVESEPFQEAGIAHVWMGRPLAAPPGERG
jgi:predicted GNAT family N-acyltransferase